MARAGLDKDNVVMRAAELTNDCGLNNLSLKDLAGSLDIKPQSLYNHIKSLNELKHAMMLFAAQQLTKEVTSPLLVNQERTPFSLLQKRTISLQ